MLALILTAFTLPLEPEFKWLEGNWKTYDKNTLFMVVEKNADGVKAQVFKYRPSDTGGAERFPVGEPIFVPNSTWQTWKTGEISFSGKSWKVKHPSRNRWDELVDEAGAPLPTNQSGFVCLPQGALDAVVQTVKDAEKKVGENLKNSKVAIVQTELNADLDWAENIFAGVMKDAKTAEILKDGMNGRKQRQFDSSDIGDAQAKVIRALLTNAENRTEFKDDPKRLQRMFHYFTLFGEFRKSGHRRLAELYWATKSIENRVEIYNQLDPKNDREKQLKGTLGNYMNVRDEYNPHPENEDWMKGSLIGAVLARSQYSAWNPGDSSLSELITGTAKRVDSKIRGDIVDFIANYEAALVKTEKEGPVLTHYISPDGFRSKSDYPSGWLSQKGYQVYKSDQLPKVFIDLGENKKRSHLISAPADRDESLALPGNFEGAIETHVWDPARRQQ